MRPALSVLLLTTLIGAAQGLFVALVAGDALGDAPGAFVMWASFAVVALALAGLVASFFHLGRPERAWRSAAKWRTSWLSREVIVLPLFIASAVAYHFTRAHGMGVAWAFAALGIAACAALFVCTAMIYASLRFLQEWASPYTIPNFVLMGCASGFTLACALAASFAPALARHYAHAALILTLVAWAVRAASLARNARLVPASTTQSAIGAASPHVRQVSRGFTAGSFNTHEFFHGRGPSTLVAARAVFTLLAFAIPVMMLAAAPHAWFLAWAAFACQYAGLLIERWYFFAEARHPQNLYYQSVA
jgi:DMSO reductase anchor subunit